ncbi:ThiF family adenylyltransferase [Alphaproteobacteria bacterium]|nr:ThiF family adenylyltransferase [Alphaproteobacteria bacterium]
MSYSDLEYEIFSRQFILPDFNEKNILKLNNAKISIIGLGGIGCSLTQYMVSSGFKNLIFFDGDKVEKSNLGRQILFGIQDLEKYKTIVAKKKLLKINSNCKISAYSEYLTKKNINVLIESDIIIDATDDWYTSKLINKFCVEKSIKYIFSSAINFNIQICLFKNNNKHVCLNCLFPNEEDADLARCETVGISSVCAGMAGLITAQKAINTVLEIKEENNILTLINAKDFEVNNISVKNNVNCLLNNC